MANKNIVRLIDSYTGENVNYEEVAAWHDGTQMDDSKVDNVIYRRAGNKYYKRVIAGGVFVGSFGNIGNDVDCTIAFKRAILYLKSIGGGTIHIPNGKFLIKENLQIPEFVSLRGQSVSGTILLAENGITMSSYADASNSIIEDLELRGSNKSGSVGINMPNTNNAFINRVYVRHYDDCIKATTAVMNKFNNITVAACKRGITFTEGSYASVINNGRAFLCSEYGIASLGSRIQIRDYDIEVCGIYNALTNKYDNGSALVVGGGSLECSGLHIETTDRVVDISGHCTFKMRDSSINSCKQGVYQSVDNLNGYIYIDGCDFVDVELDFNLPSFSSYFIRSNKYYQAGGMTRAAIYNVNSSYGVIEDLTYKDGVGFILDIKSKLILNDNKELLTGVKFVKNVQIGVVVGHFSKEIEIDSGFNLLSEWGDVVSCTFISYATPSGTLITASIKPSTTNGIILNVINTSSVDVDFGTRGIMFIIYK